MLVPDQEGHLMELRQLNVKLLGLSLLMCLKNRTLDTCCEGSFYSEVIPNNFSERQDQTLQLPVFLVGVALA